MIQIKEMMQDNDLKNSKSKDKGSRSRSQSMNDQSHYKQDKTKTRQSINFKSHIFNVRGDNDKSKQTPTRMSSVVQRSLKKETSTLGEIVSLNYIKKMSNSEGSVNKGEVEESSKKLKRKFEKIKGNEGDERIMFEFILRGFAKSKIWDKVKEPLSLKLNEDGYSICCENTTHMMNALKEARMESREMLLSIHHSLNMLLDIVTPRKKN
ncbi:hypothetical protein Tco_0811927 [Tanacetum coccineum]